MKRESDVFLTCKSDGAHVGKLTVSLVSRRIFGSGLLQNDQLECGYMIL